MTAHLNDGEGTTAKRIDAQVRDWAQANIAGRDQIIFEMPRPLVTALRTLPRDVPGFTGRRAEIRQLTATAQPTGVVVRTVDGMPGAGKTALVVQAAHRLASRFPDGQLFVSLHGCTGQRPDDPADVLAYLLAGIGIDVRDIPDNLDARTRLWRARLAGKHMLLLLDDAADHAQVNPLLPGCGDCLVLITSRRRIAVEGATAMTLAPLPPRDAGRLFTCLAHRDPATTADKKARAAIVKSCGYLPLSISLLAGFFSSRPHWNFTQLADELTATRDRLGVLDIGHRAVAAAFDTSYRDMPAERQQFFRRLALHPGTDVDVCAAAALNNVSFGAARSELEALFDDHLIDSHVKYRYHFHDLVRDYAHTLAVQDPADSREQAVRRLLGYYQHTASTADRLIAMMPRPEAASPTTLPIAPPDLHDQTDALVWIRAERANLLACLDRADRDGWSPRVIGLTAAMASFLQKEGPWRRAAGLHQRAIRLAQEQGDSLRTAGALHDLGRIRQALGEYRLSAKLYQQALHLYQASGSRLGEANVLSSVGSLRQVTDNHWFGRESHQQALNLYRALGNRLGEAYALGNLGRSQQVLGQYVDAAGSLQEALKLYRAAGNRLGEAHVLAVAGRVQYMSEDFQAAAGLLQEALGLHGALGDSQGMANTLLSLADVRQMTDGFPVAVALYRQALDLYRSLGSRHGEGNALNSLGAVLSMTGECEAAVGVLQQALDMFQELQDRIGRANALHALGRIRLVNKDFTEAAGLFQKALTQWQDLDNHMGQAEVLISYGELIRESAGPRQAAASYRQALRIARQMKSPQVEARALEGIAHCQALTAKRHRPSRTMTSSDVLPGADAVFEGSDDGGTNAVSR